MKKLNSHSVINRSINDLMELQEQLTTEQEKSSSIELNRGLFDHSIDAQPHNSLLLNINKLS